MEKTETIHIRNFGQIEDLELDLSKQLSIFIGEQASGKSTICKIVYFCKKIKEYIYSFVLDFTKTDTASKESYYSKFLKHLYTKFEACFGQASHMDYFEINYRFGNNRSISIQNIKSKKGFGKKLKFTFDSHLKEFFNKTLSTFYTLINEAKNNKDISDVRAISQFFITIKNRIRDMIYDEFGNFSEAIYIPAGRSLLATLSDQIQAISSLKTDLTMQEFVEIIANTKSKFGMKASEAVDRYLRTSGDAIKTVQVKESLEIIKEILHADYVNEDEIEKMFYDETHWVKLLMASSGQQESLWIALSLFSMILENRKCFIVIEEPEAHLFTSGQFQITKLISLFLSSTGSTAFMTTHSPYILSSVNALIFASSSALPRRYRIDGDNYQAFSLKNIGGKAVIEDIVDGDNKLINFGYIDEISSIIGELLEK